MWKVPQARVLAEGRKARSTAFWQHDSVLCSPFAANGAASRANSIATTALDEVEIVTQSRTMDGSALR